MNNPNNNEEVISSESNGSQLTRRFFISFAWTWGMFIILIALTQPKEQWVHGLIGGAIFALFSGLIAMAIPTKRKIIFVPATLFISFSIASIIGTMLGV